MKKISAIFAVLHISIAINSVSAADRLLAGQILQNDARITSPNGQFNLIMQTDGSLVLYRSDGSVRYRMEKYGSHAVMQSDGNFVQYAGARAIWHTNTWDRSVYPCPWECYLRISDYGDLLIEWEDPNHSTGGGNWNIGADPEYIAVSAGRRYPVIPVTLPSAPPTIVPNISFVPNKRLCNNQLPECDVDRW